jgi:hypothetical protein
MSWLLSLTDATLRSMKEASGDRKQIGSVLSWLLRGVIAINILRMALGWSTWFEGNADHAGMADRLFPNRSGGFRGDFLWLIVTTLMIFIAFFWQLPRLRRDRAARINALLCVLEVVGFVLYVRHALLTGVLYFG